MSASYTLNYSYNLANALNSLSIPFRSRQIGYNYDNAGRLAGVTASGFSSDVYSPRTRILFHAYNALSELTHVAGTQVSNYVEGAFSDFNLANEALHLAKNMGTGVPNLDLTPPNVNPYDDPYGRWSDYYHGIVKLYCKRA